MSSRGLDTIEPSARSFAEAEKEIIFINGDVLIDKLAIGFRVNQGFYPIAYKNQGQWKMKFDTIEKLLELTNLIDVEINKEFKFS